MIVADPSAEMLPAVAVNLVEVEPEDIGAVAGTVNAAALLDRLTVAPPVSAGLDRVTVQVAVPPESRLVDEQENELIVGLTTREIDVLAEVPL